MRGFLATALAASMCVALARGARAGEAGAADVILRDVTATDAGAAGTSGSARAAEGPLSETPRGLTGRLSFDFVRRRHEETAPSDGDLDRDLYTNLLLSWGGTEDRFSGSIYWRGVRDLDGPTVETGIPSDDPFRSSYDYLGGEWSSQLFHAYFDLRGYDGEAFARFGRQFVYEGLPLHFDGVRFDTKESAGGWRASAFGGLPVHYYEESSAEDWLAGAGIETRLGRWGRVGVAYAHWEEEARLLGLPASWHTTSLTVARASFRLGHWGSLTARYTGLGPERAEGGGTGLRTRDVLVRARAAMPRAGLRGSVSYYVQPLELAETSVGLSPYDTVNVTASPFSRVDASLFWERDTGRGRLGLGARGTRRRLSDRSDEATYNRDYDVLWYGVEIDSPAPTKLSLSAGRLVWRSPGNHVETFDAELRWRPSDSFRLSVGTTYSLFRYDRLDLSERTDVRETYISMRWKPSDKVEARLRYAAENEAGGRTHKVRMGCSFEF